MENKIINVKGGRYVGKYWFLKLCYKRTETDVDFFDEAVRLTQGSAFAVVKYKYPTDIPYKDIFAVEYKRKFSIPNVIAAIIIAILSVASAAYAGLLVSALLLFIGKTALVTIRHSKGEYLVPTEYTSEAEELAGKINMVRNHIRKMNGGR